MAENKNQQIEDERYLRLQGARKKGKAEQTLGAPGAQTRVSGIEAGLMVGFTLINAGLDYLVVGSLPVLGDIIDGITWFVIFAWVASRGLKKPQWFHFAGAIELIPFGDLLPVYTAMVLFVYIYNNNPQIKAVFGQ